MMSQQKQLRQLLREIFKQKNLLPMFQSSGQQISKKWIKDARTSVITLRKEVADANAIINFLKSNTDIDQLKRDYKDINPDQRTKIINQIYLQKSVVISWNEFFQSVIQNKPFSRQKIMSIISETLKLNKNNQNYIKQSKILIQKYDQTKNQYCIRCQANQININEDKDQIIRIKNDFAKQLQIKTKQCQSIQQKLQRQIKRAQILQQRVTKLTLIQRKQNQSAIFTQQEFQQSQFDDKFKKQKSQQFQMPLEQAQKRPLSISKELQYTFEPILRKQFILIRSIQLSLTQIKKTSQIAIQTTQIQFQQSLAQTDKTIFDTLQTQTVTIQTKQYETQTECPSYEQLFREKMQTLNEVRRKQKLFSGEVFGQQDTYRIRLVNQIQSNGKHRIKSTHLLYRFDEINKQNFHRYIDNVQGLAFVVKTKKGVYLCGYYSGKLVSHQVLNRFGLIINLNKDDSYQLKQDPQSNRVMKAMIYDDFYCIFGNADLRIKTWENHIFSNFGIMGAYFNNKGKKIQDFLGEENQRQAQFETYQFFQVKLEKQEDK